MKQRSLVYSIGLLWLFSLASVLVHTTGIEDESLQASLLDNHHVTYLASY